MQATFGREVLSHWAPRDQGADLARRSLLRAANLRAQLWYSGCQPCRASKWQCHSGAAKDLERHPSVEYGCGVTQFACATRHHAARSVRTDPNRIEGAYTGRSAK